MHSDHVLTAIFHTYSKVMLCVLTVVSVADPDRGSGAFLTLDPGSGMGK